MEHTSGRELLYGSCAIDRAELYGGYRHPVQHRGDFGLCKREFLYCDDHAQQQRLHHPVPVHGMELMGWRELMYGNRTVDRTQLYGGHRYTMPDYSAFELDEYEFLHYRLAEFQRQLYRVPDRGLFAIRGYIEYLHGYHNAQFQRADYPVPLLGYHRKCELVSMVRGEFVHGRGSIGWSNLFRDNCKQLSDSNDIGLDWGTELYRDYARFKRQFHAVPDGGDYCLV